MRTVIFLSALFLAEALSPNYEFPIVILIFAAIWVGVVAFSTDILELIEKIKKL